jgi:hypothetical protein
MSNRKKESVVQNHERIKWRTLAIILILFIFICIAFYLHLKIEFERKEFERKEFERKEFERKEFERKEFERKEFERKEFERKEFERKEFERKEFEKKEISDFSDIKNGLEPFIDQMKSEGSKKYKAAMTVLRVHPNHLAALYAAGESCQILLDFEQSSEFFSKFLSISPENRIVQNFNEIKVLPFCAMLAGSTTY